MAWKVEQEAKEEWIYRNFWKIYTPVYLHPSTWFSSSSRTSPLPFATTAQWIPRTAKSWLGLMVQARTRWICSQPCFGIFTSCISVFTLVTTILTIQEIILVFPQFPSWSLSYERCMKAQFCCVQTISSRYIEDRLSWEGQNYVMYGTTTGHDTWWLSLWNKEIWVVDPTWTQHFLSWTYTSTINLAVNRKCVGLIIGFYLKLVQTLQTSWKAESQWTMCC